MNHKLSWRVYDDCGVYYVFVVDDEEQDAQIKYRDSLYSLYVGKHFVSTYATAHDAMFAYERSWVDGGAA